MKQLPLLRISFKKMDPFIEDSMKSAINVLTNLNFEVDAQWAYTDGRIMTFTLSESVDERTSLNMCQVIESTYNFLIEHCNYVEIKNWKLF